MSCKPFGNHTFKVFCYRFPFGETKDEKYLDHICCERIGEVIKFCNIRSQFQVHSQNHRLCNKQFVQFHIVLSLLFFRLFGFVARYRNVLIRGSPVMIVKYAQAPSCGTSQCDLLHLSQFIQQLFDALLEFRQTVQWLWRLQLTRAVQPVFKH